MSSGGMNDQFNQMNQMRNASLKVRREGQRMSDLMNEQISQMREMVRSTGEESADQFRDRQKEIRQQMKDMKRYYRQNSKYLNQADKQAYKTMYKNRRRDLRDLEREARYRFRDIEEEGLDAFEKIGSKVQEIAESLRDWKVAIDVGNISEGVQDSVATVFESQKQLQKLTGKQLDELRTLSDSFRKRSKETGNKIGADEYMASATSLAEMGYKDLDFLEEMGKVVTEISHATGFATDDMKKLAEYVDTIGNSDMAYQFGNIAKTISEDATFHTSATDLMQTFENTFDSVNEQAAGDINKFNAMMKDQFSLKSLTSALYLNDYHDELYNMVEEIRKGNTDTITQISSLGLNGYDLQKMAQDGDYTGAVENILKSIQQNYGSMNDNLKTYLSNEFGFNDEMMRAINAKDLSGMDQINSSIAQAYSLAESSDSIANYIDKEAISPLEKLKNWFANSKLGSKIEQFMSDTGLSTTEGLLLINTGGQIVSNLGKGVKSIFKLFNKSSVGSTVAETAKSGGKLSNLFSNIFGKGATKVSSNQLAKAFGTNADDIVSTFGKSSSYKVADIAKTMGTNSDDVLKLLANNSDDALKAGASIASKSGGKIASLLGKGASKLAAPLAFLGLAVDGVSGGFKTKDWFGKDAGAQEVVSSTVGGILGSTGPGIMDKGSLGSKALNIGGGALKGAGVGAVLGSVIPGIGNVIGAGVGAAVGAIGSAIGGKNIAKAINWMGDRLGDVWNKFTDIAGKAWDGINDIAGKAWDGIKEFSSNAWEKTKNLGIDTFNTIVGLGDMAMEGLFSAMGLDWNETKSKISEGWTNIKNWASDKWDDISNKASEVWNGISNKANEIWTGITDWATEKWEGFKGIVSDGWNTIKDWGTETWSNVSEWASDKWNDIKDSAFEVWDSVSDKASEVWNSVKNGANKAFNSVKDKAGDIWGGIKDFFTGAKGRGEKITGIEGSHKNGLDYVPHDGYIAELHKGESVLTAEQADVYRNNQNGKSVKSWFSSIIKQIAPTLQKPVVSSISSASSSTAGEGDSASAYTATRLSGDKQEFIDKVAPGAKKGYQLYKVLPSLTLAQGALESGWGKSAIGNNLFGIKAGSNWTGKKQLVWTHEVENGVRKKVQAWFRDYDSIDDSVADHAKLLAGDRYTAVRNARGYREAARAVQSCGYATDPNYADSLIGLIESNGFAAFDKEVNAYKKGTPWVPDTQVALLHKGEAVIPAEHNPVNTGTKAELSSSNSDSSMSSGDVKEIVNVIKWMVNRLEKKLDETAGSNDNSKNIQINNQVNDRVRKSDAVFQF